MSDYKEIVCLANSYKLHGRCIAGKEVRGGIIQKWIRPVSARPGAELSLQEYQIGNGYEPDILDILRIPMEQPAPRFHQQENILIDPTKPWQKIGEYPKQNVTALLDFPRQLWPNKMSTKDGVNNCIFEKIAQRQT